ncbi:MAG: hypothetical protein ACHQ1H_00950 [Nitrososphaerales archaeon]
MSQNIALRPQSTALREISDPFQMSAVLHDHPSKFAPDVNPSSIREVPVPQNSSNPLAVTVDSAGNVWFAETNPPAIVKYAPNSPSFNVFSVPTGKSCGLIWFLIADNSNYLWFSCASEPLLWRFSMASHEFSNFSTGNPLVEPYSLALDPHTNEIWFTSIYSDQIGAFQISSDGAKLDRLVNVSGPAGIAAPLGGPRYGPSGLTFDSAGNIFITETFVAAIAEYNQNAQNLVRIWRLPTGTQPVGIAVNGTANQIWFTNHGSSLFGSINESSGRVIEFSTSLFPQGSTFEDTLPYWIKLSSDGSVWIDEHVGNKIARYDISTNQLTEFFIPTPQSAPLRFAIDDTREELWFTEFQGNKLGELSENQTCNCSAEISRNALTISGSALTNLTMNYKMQNMNNNSALEPPSISGSLSNTGALASNLSISFKTLNATAFQITLARGQNLTAGNYTLTICPGQQENNSFSMWNCPIAFLTVLGSSASSPLTNTDYIAIAAVIIVTVVAVSLFYVRRWRS